MATSKNDLSTTSKDEMTINVTHSTSRFTLTLPQSATFSQLQEAFKLKAGLQPIKLWTVQGTGMQMQLATKTPSDALLSSFGVVDNSTITALHLVKGLETDAGCEIVARGLAKLSSK